MKKYLRTILLYFITVAILCLLISYIGANNVVDQIIAVNFRYILIAFGLSIVIVIIASAKFKTLLNSSGYNVEISRCIKTVFETFPYNVIIPSKGGDFVKSWALRDIIPLSHGIGIVILERIIDLQFLFFITFIGSLLIGQKKIAIISLLIFSGIIIFLMMLYAFYKNRYLNNFKTKKILKIIYPLKCLLNDYKSIINVSAFSLAIWGITVLQVYFLYLSVGKDIPILYAFVVVPIAFVVGFIPVTVAGMGTRDLALVYFFISYVDKTSSLTVGLYLSILRYWILALIGLVVLHVKR